MIIIIVVILFLLHEYNANWWWWVLAIGAGVIDLSKYFVDYLKSWEIEL